MNKGANGRGLHLYFFLPASSPMGKWCETDAQSDTPSAILIETPHISALKGAFAKTVLMPGDPLRAKFIADTFLENAQLITSVRNMLGYTGTYKGVPVSVMASGMGMPADHQQLVCLQTGTFSRRAPALIHRDDTAGSGDGRQ